jgi:hypothetical protein
MLACRRHDRCRIAPLGIRHFPLAARRAGYIRRGAATDVTKCRMQQRECPLWVIEAHLLDVRFTPESGHGSWSFAYRQHSVTGVTVRHPR